MTEKLKGYLTQANKSRNRMKKELGKSDKHYARYRKKRVLIKINLGLQTIRDKEKMTHIFLSQ